MRDLTHYSLQTHFDDYMGFLSIAPDRSDRVYELFVEGRARPPKEALTRGVPGKLKEPEESLKWPGRGSRSPCVAMQRREHTYLIWSCSRCTGPFLDERGMYSKGVRVDICIGSRLRCRETIWPIYVGDRA